MTRHQPAHFKKENSSPDGFSRKCCGFSACWRIKWFTRPAKDVDVDNDDHDDDVDDDHDEWWLWWWLAKAFFLWSTLKSIKDFMFCWSNHSPPELACLLRLHYCCSVATADGLCGRWPLHRSSIPYNSLGDHKTMAHPWHLSQFIQMQICFGVLTWCDVSSCQLELRVEPHPCTATMRCITGNCP